MPIMPILPAKAVINVRPFLLNRLVMLSEIAVLVEMDVLRFFFFALAFAL